MLRPDDFRNEPWPVAKSSASSASDIYDLSVPGLGDVGDLIRVTVIASDEHGSSAPLYQDLVVENTPPVVTESDIIVEGYQAFEDGIYYFLVGQHARIRVRAQDDDMDPGQGNDVLTLAIDGELPPAEGGWIYHDYANGEFVVEGIIADHEDPYEATKTYTLNICVRDSYGEGDPPVFVRVTSPKLRGAMVTLAPGTWLPGSGTSSDPWILRSGTTAWFEVSMGGVGFGLGRVPVPDPVTGIQTVYYRVYDDDPGRDDLLLRDASTTLTIYATPLGDWNARGQFWLRANPDKTISGPHGDTGAGCEGVTKELYFIVWWWEPTGVGTKAYVEEVTGIFYVQWAP